MKLKSLIDTLRVCWLLPILAVASCEMVVDVDLPPHESKLVVNCLLTPDSLVTVRVYKSLGPLEQKDAEVITNASVVLLEDGVVVEKLPFITGFGKSYYRSAGFRPRPLKTYTLQVSAAGFPDVQGSCVIPDKVPIQEATIRDSAGIDEDGSYYSRLLVKFQDPGEVKNFYNLSGKELFGYNPAPMDPNAPWVYHYYPIYFYSDLNDVEENDNNGVLLKDDLFNGRTYELALNFYPNNFGGPGAPGSGGKDTMMVAFKNLAPEYYEYFRKLQQHLYNQGGDIFSGEPVVMPSNIHNGYGILAGYSQDTLLVVN